MAEFVEITPIEYASEVLDRTIEYRQEFGFTVDPVADPFSFEQLARELNPRFTGERELVRFELEETDDVEKADDGFSTEQHQLILATAKSLEMLKPETPLEGEYDLILALGAARMATYDRARYAAEAVTNGQAAGEIIVVGSTRPLVEGEAQAAASYAPDSPETEADLVVAAMEKVSDEYDIEVYAMFVENPKAHNEIILESVISNFQAAYHNLGRIAGVTTQIYRIPTSVDFARVGKRHSIDTVVAGNPSDPSIVDRRTPSTYNSEIIRTLQAVGKHFQEV